MEVKFVADVHLGKLARLLRMLGFDTAYRNDSALMELLITSDEETRILLSRNASLSKTHPGLFIVTDEDALVQLKQVVQWFDLKNHFQPFSRCMVCNGVLDNVPKESIAHLLQKNTAGYFDQFWQCRDCRRIYWKGSHYERMLKTIENIVK